MAECGLPCAAIFGTPAAAAAPALPSAITELDRLPSPVAFFEQFVLPSRPVVFRGAADASSWPPLAAFPDFSYLRTRCGHRRVCVKSLAVHDADGRPVFVSDPELKLPLVAFLEAVEACEAAGDHCPFYLGKVPLRDELPELADDLAASAHTSPTHPFSSCFGPLVPKGVFTYYGCDRNVTATHFDRSENLLVCVCGTKRLWLYPPSDTPYLYPAPTKDGSRSAAPPFRTLDEIEPGLQPTFSQVAHASPVEVRLGAGDMLYLPACWWHCVEGSKERNMILNWWFALHPQKVAQDAALRAS